MNETPITVEPKEVKPSTGAPSIQIIPIEIPSYQSWDEFVDACNFDAPYPISYKAILNANGLNIDNLTSVDYPLLSTMGIATPAHQLLIMTKINEIKEAERKQFMQEEIARQLQSM